MRVTEAQGRALAKRTGQKVPKKRVKSVPEESELEVLFDRAWAKYGKPGLFIASQLKFYNFLLDRSFPFMKIAIELDGKVHRRLSHFENDRRKDALLQVEGWIVLRLTWKMLTEEPEVCCGWINQIIERRRDG